MSQPVLVVGAGPVGLTLALALRQQEIAVRLVDLADATYAIRRQELRLVEQPLQDARKVLVERRRVRYVVPRQPVGALAAELEVGSPVVNHHVVGTETKGRLGQPVGRGRKDTLREAPLPPEVPAAKAPSGGDRDRPRGQ